MNNVKSHAITYISIGVCLFIFSFLASGWNKASLITLGIAFALTAILLVSSLKLKSRWLVRITERICKIRVSHLTIFIMLCGLAITLIQNDLVLAGIIFVYAAYIVFALRIGRELGSEVLRPLLAKWKR